MTVVSHEERSSVINFEHLWEVVSQSERSSIINSNLRGWDGGLSRRTY